MFRGILKAENTQKKIYMTGLFTGFVALIIHSTFDFDLSYISIFLLLWAMIILGTPETEHMIKLKGSWTAPILSIICATLILINGTTAIAAYNAKKGLELTTKTEYTAARPYYEEALRLDPYNYKYSYELSKLYSHFSKGSSNEENLKAWKEAALSMTKRSTSQNPYLPENNRALIRLFYELNMPLEALEFAEKVVSYQPYYDLNYKLIARSYVDAAKYYAANNNYELAKELLKKCIDLQPAVETDLKYYKEEAAIILDSN